VKTIINAAFASRRRRQATILSLSGIAVLLVGLYFNFQPGRQLILWAYVALIIGSVLSWLGVSLADQYVRPPRPEDAMAEAMKGAGAAYAMYHWALPADQALLTPFGIVLFRLFNIEGPVVVQGERWRDARPLSRRIFALGRQPIRNPARFLAGQADALRAALVGRDPALADVPILPVGLFTSPKVQLTAEDPQPPALRADALREWLRADGKRASLAPATRRSLEAALDALAEERLGMAQAAAARQRSEAAAKQRAAEHAAKEAQKKDEEKAARREKARAKRP
jgi:hypothetical protein